MCACYNPVSMAVAANRLSALGRVSESLGLCAPRATDGKCIEEVTVEKASLLGIPVASWRGIPMARSVLTSTRPSETGQVPTGCAAGEGL